MSRRSLQAPAFADYGEDEGGREEWLRNLAMLVRQILGGRTNAVGDITLSNGSGTTTLTDERIGADSHLTFMPQTANAAALAVMPYASSRLKGSATLTHTSSAQSDLTFTYKVEN